MNTRATRHPPLEAESRDDLLHALDHPVVLAADALASLDLRTLRAIEYEKREERHAHESCATEEEGAELGVLALAAVSCVVEPYASIDADAETTHAVRVRLEAVLDGEVCEGAHLACGAEDLCCA